MFRYFKMPLNLKNKIKFAAMSYNIKLLDFQNYK